jgi:N-acetylglucosamine-6-phosphate deacetylase
MSAALAGHVEAELCDGTVDLQINGAFGVDFASPSLRLEQLERCCSLLRQEGVSKILATIITDSIPNLCRSLRRLNVLRSQSSLVSEVIHGFHVEGPFLSDHPGFVGAHDPARTSDATVEAAELLFEAAAGLLKVVTLAPERDRRGEVTKWLNGHGVLVSIGHSNASLEELGRVIEAGASLVTHYGNGCPLQPIAMTASVTDRSSFE